jgi:hypothetical protein
VTITNYQTIRAGEITTVIVTSDLALPVYFHWYLDGVWLGVTESNRRDFWLGVAEQARVEVVDTTDIAFDYVAGAPDGWPSRRLIWWVRSLGADVDHYRVEHSKSAGAWSTVGIVHHVDTEWEYSLLTDRLDDLTDYSFRVVPVDRVGGTNRSGSRRARFCDHVRRGDGQSDLRSRVRKGQAMQLPPEQRAALVAELTDDPEGRGYAGMTDEEVTADLLTEYRTAPVDTVSGQDIFEAVVPGEYAALSAENTSLLHAIIGMGTVRVGGTNTRAALLAMFGAGTTTRANLTTLQTTPTSRAAELGIQGLKAIHVQRARA